MQRLSTSGFFLLVLGCGAQSGVVGESEDLLEDNPATETEGAMAASGEAEETSEPGATPEDPSPSDDVSMPTGDPEANSPNEPASASADDPSGTAPMNPSTEDPAAMPPEGAPAPDTATPTSLAPCSDDRPIELAPEEIAERMARLVFDAPASPELLEMADAGELSTYGEAECVALSMLEEPAVADGLRAFLDTWLELDDWSFSPHEELTETVWQEMQQETLSFLDEFAASEEPTLRRLLTETETEVTPALAMHYGVEAAEPSSLVTVPQRRGLLTLGQLTASLGRIGQRGWWVVSRFQCVNVPPEPPGAAELEPAQGQTFRETYESLVAAPVCSACHTLFDGAGAALENFDALGRPQTQDLGKPIDTSGSMMLNEEFDSSAFENAEAFMDALSDNALVDDCLARRALQHGASVEPDQVDAAELGEIRARFTAAERDLRHLLVGVTQSDRFWQ